jgi:hypothetical protein
MTSIDRNGISAERLASLMRKFAKRFSIVGASLVLKTSPG